MGRGNRRYYLGRPRSRRNDIKLGLKEIECEVLCWIHQAEGSDKWRVFVTLVIGYRDLGYSIKGGKILDTPVKQANVDVVILWSLCLCVKGSLPSRQPLIVHLANYQNLLEVKVSV